MSEDRFRNFDANMAHSIARRLPMHGTEPQEEPFYREVMKWCVVNDDLMEAFAKSMEGTEKGYFELLELCRKKNDAEAFAVAIAMRLQWLQRR